MKIKHIPLIAIFFLISCSVKKRIDRINVEGRYTFIKSFDFKNENDSNMCMIEGALFDAYFNEPVEVYAFVCPLEMPSNCIYIDSTNTFQLLLPHGNYKLKITAGGYKDLITDSIELKANTRIQMKFYLGYSLMW